jgi:hypothetical protein
VREKEEMTATTSWLPLIVLLGFSIFNTPVNALTSAPSPRTNFGTTTSAFVRPLLPSTSARALWSKLEMSQDEDGDKTMDETNPITKASWYAVEAFGKVFGGTQKSVAIPTILQLDQAPSSLQETLDRIKLDNDRSYFLSGQVDKLIYDPDCLFADPFVSFRGRDRFIDNLANLGSFITKYSAKVRCSAAMLIADFFRIAFSLLILWSR